MAQCNPVFQYIAPQSIDGTAWHPVGEPYLLLANLIAFITGQMSPAHWFVFLPIVES